MNGVEGMTLEHGSDVIGRRRIPRHSMEPKQGREKQSKQRSTRCGTIPLFAIAAAVTAFLLPSQVEAQTSTLCRRWDHQATVLDNKLYMLGGYRLLKEHIETGKNNTLYNNGTGATTNEFLSLDLTKSWDIEKDKTLKNPPKWESISNVQYFNQSNNLPPISGGALFSSSDSPPSLILYDGKSSKLARDQKSELVKLVIGGNSWSRIDEWRNSGSDEVPSGNISRYSRGTAVQVPGQNRYFYVGGARVWEQGKQYDWYYPEVPQLMQVDLENGAVKERTMSPMWNNTKTIGAAVAWVPIGKEGSLIVVGGTREEKDDRRFGTDKSGKPSPQYVLPKTKMNPFSETLIYDIANKKWHSQTTRGVPLPAARTGACLIPKTHTEEDGTVTHQLFLYGGSSGSSFGLGDPLDDERFFGDLYVLSIPAFRWLRFTDLENAPAARTRHTCHVINERQMLILGGGRNDTLSSNTILQKSCVWDEISVLDMTDMRWELEFKPTKEKYVVNSVIREDSLVNGKPRTSPEADWSSAELKNWFYATTQRNTRNSRTTNQLPVIVGVVIGSIATAVLIYLARKFWYRRQMRKSWVVATKVTPYSNVEVGVTPGTQVLPAGTRIARSPTSEASPDLSSTGLGIMSATAGPRDYAGPEIHPAFRPVSELPDPSTAGPSAVSSMAGGVWGKRHSYAPLAASDVSAPGPYTFSTYGGHTFAADLGSAGPYASYGDPSRDIVDPDSAVSNRGAQATTSPYLGSAGGSPYIGSGSGYAPQRQMTFDESRRVSRDVAGYLRDAGEYHVADDENDNNMRYGGRAL
ncbi:hypothetical protein DFH27DRAFT_617929 [Peziza echinospora]|nr:hypothetical protein DFH27DRAFT_617929 [Peziza echinospora]